LWADARGRHWIKFWLQQKAAQGQQRAAQGQQRAAQGLGLCASSMGQWDLWGLA
jgi:hypothetical protein